MMLFGLIGLGLVFYLLLTDKTIKLGNSNARDNNLAEVILDQRFAKGELDEATYIRMKEILKQ